MAQLRCEAETEAADVAAHHLLVRRELVAQPEPDHRIDPLHRADAHHGEAERAVESEAAAEIEIGVGDEAP